MLNINGFFAGLKEKRKERARRRKVHRSTWELIRLQQMDAEVYDYIWGLEAKVREQSKEIRVLTAACNDANMAAIDAELDLRDEVRGSRKTEFPMPAPLTPWRPGVSRG